jgi:hypothetical protein
MFKIINDFHPRNRSAEADKLFKAPEYKLVEGKTVKFSDVAVHEFTMGDVEDPDLYAAQPIMEWQQSEMGEWVMEHAIEKPFWHRHIDSYSYGYKYYIIARLAEQDELYWALKWKK